MKYVTGELARFLVTGIGSNILNFLVYLLAHVAGAPLMAASATGYLAGLLNSYHFNRVWVFNAERQFGRTAIIRFATVYVIGGAGMSGIIEALDRMQGLDYRVSWFFGALFAFTNNFIGSKWLVFRESKIRNGN